MVGQHIGPETFYAAGNANESSHDLGIMPVKDGKMKNEVNFAARGREVLPSCRSMGRGGHPRPSGSN
jgi:hypothetical protein